MRVLFEIVSAKYLVIVDESQKAYADEKLWSKFKGDAIGGRCSLLAFSAYTVPEPVAEGVTNEYVSTPMIFSKYLGYSFLAFDESEFIELKEKFAERFPGRFTDKEVEFVKENVSSSPPDVNERVLFHPGLSYACLQLISTMSITKVPDIVAELGRENQLYDSLRNKMRCFKASLSGLSKAFERRYTFYLKSNNREIDQSVIDDFNNHFQALMWQLIMNDCIELSIPNVAHKAYRDVLVRYALCCDIQKSSYSVIYLSCPLVRQHFFAQLCECTWSSKPEPACDVNTVEDYVKCVVSSFSPVSFLIYGRDQKGHLSEAAFHAEFLIKSQRMKKKAIMQHRLVIDGLRGKKKQGRIDCYINGDLHWGVELLGFSSELKKHANRFEPGRPYSKLGQYCILDCHHYDQFKKPSIEPFKDLTSDQTKSVIVAVFYDNFSRVKLLKPKEDLSDFE